jgi:predicted dehydrogenase
LGGAGGKVKFLLCGLGSIGRRHFRNLRALGQDDLVLLRSGKSTLPDEDLAGVPTESDLEIALAVHHPDAVIVANPTSHHLLTALSAAKAGCHILIEKPLSDTLEGVEELASIAELSGSKILVGFQFRYHPGLAAVKQLLSDEVIGAPVNVRAHWGEYLPDWHPWEDYRQSYSARETLGGGVVLTLCHPFDYLRWLFGEVKSVQAHTGQISELELEVEDNADVLLEFESGAVGSVHLDYFQRPPSHTLELTGTRGRIRWDNADGAVQYWTAGNADWQRINPPEDFERNALFLDEMQHFLDVVQERADPICSLDDGIRALEIALAIKSASRERKLIQLRGFRERN